MLLKNASLEGTLGSSKKSRKWCGDAGRFSPMQANVISVLCVKVHRVLCAVCTCVCARACVYVCVCHVLSREKPFSLLAVRTKGMMRNFEGELNPLKRKPISHEMRKIVQKLERRAYSARQLIGYCVLEKK